MMHYGYGGTAWPMWIMMMVFWLGVILLVVWLVNSQRNRSAAVDDKSTARRILAERYARGELDTEEFNRRLENLR
ncbi:MAG TPA: SHOCT domain-containing protein [Micromonosporaceae bacterium]|nr:SHOCT domain-containing protein [Micromonosporaceae bacterium]